MGRQLARSMKLCSLALVGGATLLGCAGLLGLDEVAESTSATDDAMVNPDGSSSPPREGGGGPSDGARDSDALTDGNTVKEAAVDTGGPTDPCPNTIVTWDFEGAIPPMFKIGTASNGTLTVAAGEGNGGGHALKASLGAGLASALAVADLSMLPTNPACTGGRKCAFDMRHNAIGDTFFTFVAAMSGTGGDGVLIVHYQGQAWLTTLFASYISAFENPHFPDTYRSFGVELRTTPTPKITVTGSMTSSSQLGNDVRYMQFGVDKGDGEKPVDVSIDNIVCRRTP